MTPRPRLLVVDDDQAIIDIYREALEREGYQVASAANCASAMQQLEVLQGDVQAMLVDLGLPDGDGADFARDAAKRFGPRPTLYVSGWTDEFWQLDDVPGRWLILRKPVRMQQLLAGINWLVRGGPRPQELDV